MSRPRLEHGDAAADSEAASSSRAAVVRPAGERVRPRFEIHCRACGFGGVVVRVPERCPMCGGCAWEREVEELQPLVSGSLPVAGNPDGE